MASAQFFWGLQDSQFWTLGPVSTETLSIIFRPDDWMFDSSCLVSLNTDLPTQMRNRSGLGGVLRSFRVFKRCFHRLSRGRSINRS